MKSVFASILLVIYFTVSTGFSVNLHYCMDNFQSWEFGAIEDEKCSKCGMKTAKSSGCCRDEVKVLKLKADAFKQTAIAFTIELPPVTTVPSNFLQLPFQNATASPLYLPHGPPLISKQETYLDNCVFRI